MTLLNLQHFKKKKTFILRKIEYLMGLLTLQHFIKTNLSYPLNLSRSMDIGMGKWNSKYNVTLLLTPSIPPISYKQCRKSITIICIFIILLNIVINI